MLIQKNTVHSKVMCGLGYGSLNDSHKLPIKNRFHSQYYRDSWTDYLVQSILIPLNFENFLLIARMPERDINKAPDKLQTL